MRTLTPHEQTQRLLLRTIHNAHEKWRAGRSSYKIEDVPEGLRMSNEQRSQLEVLDFIADSPKRVFAYIKEINGRLSFVTTFMGGTLATITWAGEDFHVWGFGQKSTRANFRCVGINGRTYSGTYFKSSGSYCRMKEVKP